MEPRPLLDGDATAIERALLRAGRVDGPRQEATAHLLAVLQALPPAPGPSLAHSMESGPGNEGHGASFPNFGKWVKLGLLAAAVGGGVAATTYLAQPNGPVAVPAIAEPGPVAAPREVHDEVSATPELGQALATARVEDHRLGAGEGHARRRKTNAPVRLREPTRDEGQAPLDGSLGDETRALDRAREALEAHRGSEAMRELDEYQRHFPRGRMRPESMVLRLAALVQTGRRGAADALANQLLADEAYQTYATRIRSLLQESKP